MCCGRPLYDFGMLDKAKQYLTDAMDALAEEISAGTPIVVLEPSCASVFRDEAVNLMPDDPRTAKLKQQTMLLSEFLVKHAPDYVPAPDSTEDAGAHALSSSRDLQHEGRSGGA